MFPQGPAEHRQELGQCWRCRQSQAGSGPRWALQPCHKLVNHHLQPSLGSCPHDSKAGHTAAAAPLISLPSTHGWGGKVCSCCSWPGAREGPWPLLRGREKEIGHGAFTRALGQPPAPTGHSASSTTSQTGENTVLGLEFTLRTLIY